MESKIKILGTAFMLMIGLEACEKSYIEPNKKQMETETIQEKKPVNVIEKEEESFNFQLTHGAWQIATFQWKLKDKNDHFRSDNDHFKGYLFYFQPNEVVTVIHDDTKEQGRWEKKNDLFTLEFKFDSPLSELNNNKWNFKRGEINEFILRGLSPIDDSGEFVAFER